MPQKFMILICLFIAATNVVAQNNQNDLDKYFSTLSRNQQFNGNVLITENEKILDQLNTEYIIIVPHDNSKQKNMENIFVNELLITRDIAEKMLSCYLQYKGFTSPIKFEWKLPNILIQPT